MKLKYEEERDPMNPCKHLCIEVIAQAIRDIKDWGRIRREPVPITKGTIAIRNRAKKDYKDAYWFLFKNNSALKYYAGHSDLQIDYIRQLAKCKRHRA